MRSREAFLLTIPVYEFNILLQDFHLFWRILSLGGGNLSKKFTLSEDLGQSLIELKEKDDETFICLKCSSDVKQTAPNPYVWICENCQANYMGPLFE